MGKKPLPEKKVVQRLFSMRLKPRESLLSRQKKKEDILFKTIKDDSNSNSNSNNSNRRSSIRSNNTNVERKYDDVSNDSYDVKFISNRNTRDAIVYNKSPRQSSVDLATLASFTQQVLEKKLDSKPPKAKTFTSAGKKNNNNIVNKLKSFTGLHDINDESHGFRPRTFEDLKLSKFLSYNIKQSKDIQEEEQSITKTYIPTILNEELLTATKLLQDDLVENIDHIKRFSVLSSSI